MDSNKLIEKGTENCSAVVILLHGLGADGNDLAGLTEFITPHLSTKALFSYPTAKVIPVALNGGMHMPSWYPIDRVGQSKREDIIACCEDVRELIAEYKQKGIAAESIILGGFSQGGAVAAFTVLNQIVDVGGLLVMSSYYPNLGVEKSNLTLSSKTHACFMHGAADPVIPQDVGKSTYTFLQSKYPEQVQWHSYSAQHNIDMQQQVLDIAKFINKVLDN